jgi:hypothetical protein
MAELQKRLKTGLIMRKAASILENDPKSALLLTTPMMLANKTMMKTKSLAVVTKFDNSDLKSTI